MPFASLVPNNFDEHQEIVPDIVERPELPADFDNQLKSLIALTDEYSVDELIGLLSRVHFAHHAPCGQIYDWIDTTAQAVGNYDLATAAQERRRYFLGV